MPPRNFELYRQVALEKLPQIIIPSGIAASGEGKFRNVIFCRDGAYFILSTLTKPQNGELPTLRAAARNTLMTTARFQTEKGEFPHEIHDENSDQERLASLKKEGVVEQKELDGKVVWVGYQNGLLDGAPLWIASFATYIESSGDRETLDLLWPNFESGLSWIYKYGDLDGDGLIEGGTTEIRNPWWKDSRNSLIDEDGNLPAPPISPLDANSFAYLAEISAANLYLLRGDTKKAEVLQKAAEARKQLVNKLFWMSDLNTFTPALDGRKQPVRIVTSDAALALWTGIIEDDKVRQTVNRLLEPDLLTPCGLRTRSRFSKRYNSLDYQNGNVWPHLALLAAAACEKLGLAREAEKFEESLPEIARLGFPELLVVDDKGNPHPYLEDEKPAAGTLQAFPLGGALNRTAA